MNIKKRVKSTFKLIIMLILIAGITPIASSALPGQLQVVNAATITKINKTKATLIKGKTVQLKLTGTKGKIVWSSSNKKIAVVSSNGKVTAKAKGTAVITAKVQNKKYTCKIKVEAPKISKTSVTLYKNGSCTLKMLDTAQKVTWKSSKTSVATVNNKGKITAKAPGTATVTATVANKKYTCKITVKQKNIPISKVPVCAAHQTVYARGDGDVFDNLVLPECFIYIKNLDKNAKVVNIKSSNPKIKVRKREDLDAIEVSNVDYSTNLAGLSSKITFKVIQNKKTYNLSCSISVVKSPTPFAEFKVGSKDIAKIFSGTDMESASFSGKKKVSIKMTKDYVLDFIDVFYEVNGDIKYVTIKNGANINFKNCKWISVNYHKTKKPANYVPSTKWYGVVKSPLHDHCILNIY